MSGRADESTLDSTSPARPDEAAPRAEVALETSSEVLLGVGDRAGDFVIEGVIGRGSFGTVYRAAHAVIGRRAAIKVLREHAAEGRAIASFIDEARLVARLRHPNIVDVLTFGQFEDGRHYQVMDLIEGPTLTHFMRERGAVSIPEALPILRGIASALDAVHRAGVAHSDLKPANVVLEQRDGEFVPKLIDFGIARLIAPEADGAPAARSTVAGTPRYMSPEQCRGRTADARTDAYAFGLLTYELLTGRLPFTGDDALELMLKHTSETPAGPSKVCTSLPALVDPIVLSLLEKNAELRPVELAPVVQALETAGSGGAALELPTPNAPASRRTVWIAALALIAAILVFLVLRSQRSVPTEAAVHTEVGPPSTVSRVSAESLAAPTASVFWAERTPEATALASAAPTGEAAKAPRPDRTNVRERRAKVAPESSSAAESLSESPSGPGLEDTENPFKR